MKEKKLEKAEMKESLLSGEALALNDAELEGAAGGVSPELEAALAASREVRGPVVELGSGNAERISDSEIDPSIMEKVEQMQHEMEKFKPNTSFTIDNVVYRPPV